MNKTTEALNLAEALENDAKEHREVSYGLDCPPERTANWKHALNCEAAARLIREALAEPVKQEPVAWVNAERNTITWEKIYPNMEPLYAAPVQPVKQEPVGYTNKEQLRLLKDPRNPIGMWTTPFQTNNVPLYAAPVSAKREWVDLTDDDVEKIKGFYSQASFETIVRAVITAFKEKNT